MINYKPLLSAEINSLDELKKNYLADLDTLEKLCACSVAYRISDEVAGAGENILHAGLQDDTEILTLQIGEDLNRVIAYDDTYVDPSNRIPTGDMLMSIRTISKYI